MKFARLSALVVASSAMLALAGCGDDADPDAGALQPAEKASTSGSAAAAVAAVNDIAPRLESAVRGEDYPQTLADAVARIDQEGLTPQAPLQVAGYRYDPDQVEFTLCIEDADTGAYATYDTAPMSVRQTGESGGCAEADLGG